MAQPPNLRNAIPFVVLSFFLVYIFSSGVQHEFSSDIPSIFMEGSGFPDFGNYRRVATVSAEQLSLDDPDRRAIIVGDIHGMKWALDDLLKQVSYDEEKDTLIHLGDIITRGPHAGSLSVLSFMNKHNITGVRGNHDQKVVEWRAWLNWINGLEAGAGSRWLLDLEKKWEEGNINGELEDDSDTEEWVGTQIRMGRKNHKWWSRIPKGWKLFSDHYRIARAMSKSDYRYLLSLPLVLHVPSEHAFLVHAGLLPYDPTHSITSKRQPLAHLPKLRSATLESSIPALRNAQELAILDDIKQNNNPWVVLNIRNLRKDNTVSRKTGKGRAWADVWNGTVSQCAGFERAAQAGGGSLPCHPSTVIYGHAASRRLDIHRWAVGLDTGCVYGRRLTALVLGAAHSHRGTGFPNDYGISDDDSSDLRDDDDDGDGGRVGSNPETLPFGDNGQGRLVSVRCHKHKKGQH
ncbi:Metallo-dependent phosphatase-like protein [Lactifluus subvellereus]|nr:Metallo-dependent phosphatase-like protein [Lactifluus subvellereus]